MRTVPSAQAIAITPSLWTLGVKFKTESETGHHLRPQIGPTSMASA